MTETAKLPDSGPIAYLGPALEESALAALKMRGFELDVLNTDSPAQELPAGATAFVHGLGLEHPVSAALQREAVGKNLPVFTDLAFLGAVAQHLPVPDARRVLITGSAGKSTTAALLARILAQGGQDCAQVSAESGFLNAMAKRAENLIIRVRPSAVRYMEDFAAGVGVVLNLTEEQGGPVSPKTKESCVRLLTAARLGVLGADDSGAQALLMALRRQSASSAREIIPISGGSTLSDGYFAIDRVVYSVRNGRTRRIASYAESAVLLGDHFAQDAAAACAVAGHFGVTDDQIAEGLAAYRGLQGRFDCIGTEGRVVFVDDRFARCAASTKAAIDACPEVFWVGHRMGDVSKKTRAAMRGAFYVTAPDGFGPPVDNVVTFKDAEDATSAALRAAADLIRRQPGATPVILFSPGADGFDRQGELFRLKALSYLSDHGRKHG
ncbi:Mur ligase family protein [Parvularcula lutaonensis]|uniref:Mur ligase central domain-containing protein n=1 Tax=Parvularcula lutaonensis TaxID=491923 RepID=A0ABV7M7C7_9PROT|nr:hypothetical protein [Parvularcula lutaonensis]GGY41642.1 UDP-N-acetylmuramoylalanine--D-glutamate ligase [Parvularcula lutaonensis]